MTQQQQKQQPNIVTYLFNISKEYYLGLNAKDEEKLDENLANIKNDLDNLKKILKPIFSQIQNPIYYLLEEIKTNKDTSLNVYILFINYILNEINLLINTRVKEFYGKTIEDNPEYVEFIESSKINKYIKGTYDYTELFKEKDIKTEYLFSLFEDILYKTIKPYLKKKIEERAAEAAAEEAIEAALTPKERALRKEQREREKEAAQEAAAIA
jgi:RecG-like helicase